MKFDNAYENFFSKLNEYDKKIANGYDRTLLRNIFIAIDSVLEYSYFDITLVCGCPSLGLLFKVQTGYVSCKYEYSSKELIVLKFAKGTKIIKSFSYHISDPELCNNVRSEILRFSF